MLLGISLLSVGVLLSQISFGKADQFSGLCPPSYPRRVSYNGTGHCFEVGSKGPCGRLAVIASDPQRPNFGYCRCKDYGSDNCFGRPLLPLGERCYFEFSQGPCRKGQWFIRNKYGNPECRKMPCPMIERQRDLLFSEYPENDFYFTVPGSNRCFKTGSQAFCSAGERAYFLGSDTYPICLRYDPYNCNAVPSNDYYDANGNGNENNHQSQGLLAFGAPYEGI